MRRSGIEYVKLNRTLNMQNLVFIIQFLVAGNGNDDLYNCHIYRDFVAYIGTMGHILKCKPPC